LKNWRSRSWRSAEITVVERDLISESRGWTGREGAKGFKTKLPPFRCLLREAHAC
jgi:hypothetical protein